jgi:GGDEF domain-containing protein
VDSNVEDGVEIRISGLLLGFGAPAGALLLRLAIMAWLTGNPLRHPVTVTIGIAAGLPSSDRDDYFARADDALYGGKRGGRNQIRVFDSPQVIRDTSS